MLIFRFVFVIFNLLSRAIWTQNIKGISADPIPAVDFPGASSWCVLYRNGGAFPAAPAKCCEGIHQCNVIIYRGRKKYGIRNKSQWRKRLCECDAQFEQCMVENLPYDQQSVRFETMRMTCLVPKQCPTDKPCPNQYVEMNYGNYRTLMSPPDYDNEK